MSSLFFRTRIDIDVISNYNKTNYKLTEFEKKMHSSYKALSKLRRDWVHVK